MSAGGVIAIILAVFTALNYFAFKMFPDKYSEFVESKTGIQLVDTDAGGGGDDDDGEEDDENPDDEKIWKHADNKKDPALAGVVGGQNEWSENYSVGASLVGAEESAYEAEPIEEIVYDQGGATVGPAKKGAISEFYDLEGSDAGGYE